MKFIKRTKKILMSVIATIMLLPMKITSAIDIKKDTVSMYGVPEVKKIFSIWDILKIAIIPIILIIGFFIYFKKSKRKTYEKVLIMIIILLVLLNVVLIWMNIN